MKYKISIKSSVFRAALLSSVAITPAYAENVSSWLDIENNTDASEISFTNDIKASGKEYYETLVITLTSDGEQTIDGNHHSFSGDDRLVDKEWYYYNISVQKTGGSLTLQNMGKVSDGTADTNTFSYVDLDGNTVYKTIDTKVSDWNTYFLTVHNPIDVDIKDSVFADNGKDNDARLICMQPSSGGTLNVTDSVFYNNTTASTYAALYTTKSDLNVDNTIFYGNLNTAQTLPWGGRTPQGGALQSDGGKVAITNSYFINNTAARETIAGKGGAVYIGSGTGHTIENSKFEGNRAARTGGGFYQYYNATVDYIKNSEFIGNEATGSSGGGVALGGGYLRTIDNVLFDNNVSGNSGGGLYVEELVEAPEPKVMLIKDTTFTNNSAVLGGGMYFSADFGINENFAARVVDPEFTSNTATKGGALYIINGDLALISENKDIIFTGNTATDTSVANAGDDVYVKTNTYAGTLYLNAADDKKIAFNGSIGAEKRKSTSPTPNIAINKSDMTYSTYEGETETVHNAGTTGEIQFNNKVGDESENIFNINLYGGTLSIGQNSTVNAGVENADGYINNNNFTIAGDSTLNTANGLIGLFAPTTFNINAAMQYSFDIDLENAISDKLANAVVSSDGSVLLSNLNIITDTNSKNIKITYSDNNIGGILKDGYTISTTEETYDVSAGNDETGSYLLISKAGAGGLPGAISGGSDAYSITTEEDNEVIEEWDGTHSLIADMVINGNGHGFTTENNLEGIDVGEDYHLTMNNVTEMNGFQYSISNVGTVELNGTTLHGNLTNSGEATLTNSYLYDALENSGNATLTNSTVGSLANTGSASLTDSVVTGGVTSEDEITLAGTQVGGDMTNSGTAEITDESVITGVLNNSGTATLADVVIGALTNTGGASLTDSTINGNVNNENELILTGSNISGNLVNNGSIDINEGSSVQAVSGSGIMNLNTDYAFQKTVDGNTINVNGATVSNLDKLSQNTNMNVVGGVVDLGAQSVTLKKVTFDSASTLSLFVNSSSNFGSLSADEMIVANGATLSATLAPGIVTIGKTASLQLLSANNGDFNNFTDTFDNNMYHFEKSGNTGIYNIRLVRTAEDVVNEAGGSKWVAHAAKAYVDSETFAQGTISANIADKLADLAQNDATALITEIKNIAPIEGAIIQDRTIADTSRLFRIVDDHLQGIVDPSGISAGDMLSDVSIWAKPYTGKTKINQRGTVAGQKSTNFGLIAAIEKKVEPEIKVGMGLHYDKMDVDILSRDADVDTIAGFAYMKYQPSNLFINAIASYANSDYDEHKFALGSAYNAKYDVYTTSAAIMSGYQFKYFTPEVGVHYYHIERIAYTDTAAQYVRKLNTNYLRTTAGVHFDKSYGIFQPELYLGVSYDLVSPVDRTTVNLMNGTSYVVDGERLPRLRYELSVGLNASLTDNVTLGINYSGAYRRKYREHTGMIKFKYDF